MYPDPNLGATEASGGALDGTTGTLTAAGLAAFPELAGPIPFATGTYGYGATVDAGAPYTTLLANSAGQALAGVYQHPSTDPQAGVAELSLYFDYNATQLQWLLLAPGLINWVTQGTHLGLDRNYVEMDIDDTFTPDNAWSTTVHDNDYSDADSLRMDPQDVITAADWSNPAQERLRPPGRQASRPRPSAWTSCSTTAAPWSTRTASWTCPASRPPATRHPDAAGTCGPTRCWPSSRPQTPPPASPTQMTSAGSATPTTLPTWTWAVPPRTTSKPSSTRTPPTRRRPPGATPGTGGLGLAVQTIPAGATDVPNPYGTYNPHVFVPGNHSGFADLDPGTPATVDPPDLDEAAASTTGGTLAAGTYEYAVTDQFNGADSTSTDQSQAYVTDGQQGDVAPSW